MSRQGITSLVGAVALAVVPALLHSCDHILLSAKSLASKTSSHAKPVVERAVKEVEVVAPRVESAAAHAIADESTYRSASVGTRSVETPNSAAPIPYPRRGIEGLAERLSERPSPWKEFAGEIIERPVFASGVGTPDTVVTRPHLLAAFPTNGREYQQVYGASPTAAADKELANLTKRLSESDGGGAQRSKYPVKLSFKDALKNIRDADFVVIIAHAEDAGETLILPNGQRITYREVHSACGQERKKCVVLSCYGKDVSLNVEVSTSDAISMWSSAAKKWAKPDVEIYASGFVRDMREARTGLKQGRHIVVTTVLATSVTGGGISYNLIVSRQEQDLSPLFGRGKVSKG